MTQISITAETSDRTSLEEARALIDRLLAPAARPPKNEPPGAPVGDRQGSGPPEPSDTEVAERFVDDLWNRTRKGRPMISIMASFDGVFTLVDIAEKTGETLPKTHSRFASLHRSVKAARNNVPGAPELVTGHHQEPGGLWHFEMAEPIREAVRRAEARDS